MLRSIRLEKGIIRDTIHDDIKMLLYGLDDLQRGPQTFPDRSADLLMLLCICLFEADLDLHNGLLDVLTSLRVYEGLERAYDVLNIKTAIWQKKCRLVGDSDPFDGSFHLIHRALRGFVLLGEGLLGLLELSCALCK